MNSSSENNDNAKSQFELSKRYFNDNKIELMLKSLHQSANSNYLPAVQSLANIYAKGGFLPVDLSKAENLYQKAIDQGCKQSLFQMAELKFINGSSTIQIEAGIKYYWLAAQLGNPQALFLLYLFYKNVTNAVVFSQYCLIYASMQEFLPAIVALNYNKVLHENNCVELSKKISKLSDASNYPNLNSHHELFVDFKCGEKDELKKLKDTIYKTMQLPNFSVTEVIKSISTPKLLAKSINLNLTSDFLDKDEAKYIVFLSRPYQEKAKVINSDSDRGSMDSSVRTNSYMYFSPTRVSGFIKFIERKICDLVRKNIEESEPLSVLHYKVGQEYKPHFDFFDPSLPVSKSLLEKAGQRTRTVLLYLNDVEIGGDTYYPEIDISVAAKRGTLVYMDNCYNDGSINLMSLHAGRAILKGEKWVAVKWFREGKVSI